MSILYHASPKGEMLPAIKLKAGACLVGAMFLCGCELQRHVAANGPSLVLRDSTVVRESDTAFIADVGLIAAEDSGWMLVGDDIQKRVWLLGPDGRLIKSFGAQGEGPGELLLLGTPLFLGDTMVAVADNRRRLIEVFHRETAGFERQAESPGIVYDGVWRDGVAWLGALDRASGKGVARWDTRTDSITRIVALPERYSLSQQWAGMNTLVSVDEWRDTLFVGFSGENTVLVADTSGAVLQLVDVPRVRRRGVPTDILLQLKSVTPAKAFELSSALFALHRLPTGELALVHYDQHVDGRHLIADAYVSVISADRSSACVDGMLPVRRHSQPAVAWRGDDLVVVEQVVVESTRAVTIARTYEIRLDECDWFPVD